MNDIRTGDAQMDPDKRGDKEPEKGGEEEKKKKEREMGGGNS